MSLVTAAVAIKTFLKKLEVAQDMATAGAVGSVLYSVLSDADALLKLIDEELADVDRARHASLFYDERRCCAGRWIICARRYAAAIQFDAISRTVDRERCRNLTTLLSFDSCMKITALCARPLA
jgi:hypothetical protein